MSVTTVFRCFHDKDLKHWVNNREHFEEKNYPDCESIQLGVELLAVADLVARARNKQTHAPQQEFLFKLLVGIIGRSVYADGDYPRIISTKDIANASRMMNALRNADLREVYDLDRLKVDYHEIEEWLWEALGPKVLEDRLMPMFDQIRAFFNRVAARKQIVVVSWF